jgi:hypothetical protein
MASDAVEPAVQILDLPSGQLLTLSAARVQQVQVLYGRVWLTESGRSEDVFAASGALIDLSRDGRVLIEGLGFARIAVFARADARTRAGRALHRWARSGQALAQRLRAASFGAGAARPAA